jgi:hypothetical protein
MSDAVQGGGGDGDGPERIYVITGGRSGSERSRLDLVTLIVTRSEPQQGTPPEQRHILRMCSSPLSAAEISSYLGLPFSAVAVLLADLLAEELVEARAPIPPAVLPDAALIEQVMHGLERL